MKHSRESAEAERTEAVHITGGPMSTFVAGKVGRRSRIVVLGCALALSVTALPPAHSEGTTWTRGIAAVVDPALSGARGAVHVIVSGIGGGASAVANAVRGAHGRVDAPLPIVDGVGATVPASQLS